MVYQKKVVSLFYRKGNKAKNSIKLKLVKIKNMKTTLTIGQEVTRTAGDYVVGRKGIIVAIKGERVQVAWYGETKTWVNVKVITKGNVEVKQNNQSKKEEAKAIQIEQLKKQLERAEKLQDVQLIKVAKYRLEQATK